MAPFCIMVGFVLHKLKFGGILLANSNELENELRMFRISQQRTTENSSAESSEQNRKLEDHSSETKARQ